MLALAIVRGDTEAASGQAASGPAVCPSDLLVHVRTCTCTLKTLPHTYILESSSAAFFFCPKIYFAVREFNFVGSLDP